MNLKSKIILVVGGAAGIGRATAELCAERRAAVIVADRDEANGQQVAQSINARFIPVDVANEESVQAL